MMKTAYKSSRLCSYCRWLNYTFAGVDQMDINQKIMICSFPDCQMSWIFHRFSQTCLVQEIQIILMAVLSFLQGWVLSHEMTDCFDNHSPFK